MKKIFIALLPFFAIVMLVNTGLAQNQNSASLKSKNIKMVQTYWEEVWGKGNLKAIADFYDPNAKHGEDFTIEGFQKGVTFTKEAFPDFKATVIDIFATGDKVISEVIYTGTHTGKKMFKQEALSKTVKVPGLDVFTFKNGKCVNHQHVADHLELVMQMGLKLTPTKDSKVAEQEIKKAGQDYLHLAKRLISGKTHEELVKSGDIEALNKILADEYSYTDPKGVIYNKTEELDFYKKNSIVLKSLDLEDQKIYVDGNTAVETGIIRFIYTNAGKPLDFTKRYTTTWIWRDGRWQIFADHASEAKYKTK